MSNIKQDGYLPRAEKGLKCRRFIIIILGV